MNSKATRSVMGQLHLLLFVVYYFQSQCARPRIRSLIRCTAEAIDAWRAAAHAARCPGQGPVSIDGPLFLLGIHGGKA